MITYPIKTRDGEINELRVKRLLLLAGKGWNKRFYSQYYYLCGQGLTGWCIGMAYLTEKGKEELQRLLKPAKSAGAAS